ncbi:MAG: hypothetical protein OEU46_13910, partial [Alphaproteobacteria bacterium]|nr:hypothetical protein [Alphaproteobacteria bacterium]
MTSNDPKAGKSANTSNLDQSDVKRLLSDPSAEVRADTASKVAAEFGTGVLSDGERVLAEEIFRVMAKDVEVLVRESLSQSIRDIPDVSSDIARVLAEDENDSVALPILEFSQALS